MAALTTNSFVSERGQPGDFCLFADGRTAAVLVDTNDWPGVVRAAKDLRSDMTRVSSLTPVLTNNIADAGASPIIVGTIGRNALLDALIKEKKIDVTGVAGAWEAGVVQVVENPFPGVKSALVIAGSDKRGTIYAAYDISEQMGVSPWHWFADIPAKHHEKLFARAGRHWLAPPVVKYRGIFINDEGPCLMTWARQKYGELNHGMYTNVFELILRMKGNCLWPAMWDNSFATDDPLNAKLADEYGVVMGTSHHEPLMRAWQEWKRAGNGPHSWDYVKNKDKLQKFWAEGLRRTKDYEKLITIGMRGDGDEPMSEKESVSLLEKIVADQRSLIGDIISPNVEQVPQVWALYKEVQGYYERGMRVPDDVTLLWCDDNWGDIRRLPTETERRRAGGAGIYYHFDYVGGPRNYKWINTSPLPKVWEQMNLAYAYGATNLWIANVGDIKPLEVPIEFFLTFAWNPSAWTPDSLNHYLKLWATREFGPGHAGDIAEIVAAYAKYNGRRKPELLSPDTFSLQNYNEAARVEKEWQTIADKAEAIYATLPGSSRDAFYELVLFPVKASATVTELYIAAARNRFYAQAGDGRANTWAARAKELFKMDADLAGYYNHKLAGGKWNHMMDQTHISYATWQQPDKDVMPAVVEITNSVAKVDSLQTQPASRALPENRPKDWRGFVESGGCVSIEAAHYAGKRDSSAARWVALPDHGRTLCAMTVMPPTAPSVNPPSNPPVLEYRIWLTNTGPVKSILYLSPCLNFAPDRGVRIAASIDDEPPQLLTVVPKDYIAGDGNADWEQSVRDEIRKVVSSHNIASPGAHTLRIWMVDPAVVVQKIVIDCGGLRPSYLGPPESTWVGRD